MSYPKYKRIGDKFFKAHSSSTMSSLEATESDWIPNREAAENVGEVVNSEEAEDIPSTDYELAIDDMGSTVRVGGHPVPPPHPPK